MDLLKHKDNPRPTPAPPPPPISPPASILPMVSVALGWSYFVAWSLSFWPQVILNFRRKSVVGLSFDFVVLNALGFTCLTAVTTSFLFSEEVRREYRDRNGGKDPLVDMNDLVFAIHALVMTLVVLVQIAIYDRGTQRVSTWVWSFVSVAVALAMAITGWIVYSGREGHHGVAGIGMDWKDGGDGQPLPISRSLSWLDLMFYLSYVKLAVTTIKYIPQVVLNSSRASTQGWSITNIWLDATGGVLSLCQLVVDAAITQHWEGIWGNPVKLGMAFLSLAFDAVFFVQHYVLYLDRTEPVAADPESGTSSAAASASAAARPTERDPLLGRQNRSRAQR